MSRGIHFEEGYPHSKGLQHDAPDTIWGTGWYRDTLVPLLRATGDADLLYLAQWLERDGELGEDARGNFLIPELIFGAPEPDEEDADWQAGSERLRRIAGALSAWETRHPDAMARELADGLSWCAQHDQDPWIGW